MRVIVSLLVVALVVGNVRAIELEVPRAVGAETSVYVPITAKTDGVSVRWFPLDKGLNLFPIGAGEDGRTVKVMAKKPRKYRLACIAAGSKGELSEVEVCIVAVEHGEDDPPAALPAAPPAPKKTSDPEGATVRIQFGNAGCTATVIGPRRPDGKWAMLTASHCIRGAGQHGTARMKDGRNVAITVVSANVVADVAWCVTDDAIDSMPWAELSPVEPDVGDKVWHCGYGVDKPGNREEGRVIGKQDASGKLAFMLNVSHGDSGAGIFAATSGQLVAVVCCSSGVGKLAPMRGGSSLVAARLRGNVADEWKPMPMPNALEVRLGAMEVSRRRGRKPFRNRFWRMQDRGGSMVV